MLDHLLISNFRERAIRQMQIILMIVVGQMARVKKVICSEELLKDIDMLWRLCPKDIASGRDRR